MFINIKKFVAVALNTDNKTFVVHMTVLNIRTSNIHPFLAAQIRFLKAKKTFIIIFAKYFDYTNSFLSNLSQNFQNIPV